MSMLIRFPKALLAIFLASSAIAAMDQRIPEHEIIYAAQKCVSEILAVSEPPHGEENDPCQGFWIHGFAYYKAIATLMITNQGEKAAKLTEALRYYADPEFNTQSLIESISKESPNVLHPRKQARDLLSWSIPRRVPFFYHKALRTLINSYPMSYENSNIFFGQTCCRLSDAIGNHIREGSHYRELIGGEGLVMLSDEAYLELVEGWFEDDGSSEDVADYNTKQWKWYNTHGVAEGTHERLRAAGAREVLMQTYKAADSL